MFLLFYGLCFVTNVLLFFGKFWVDIGGQEDMRPIYGIIAAGKKVKLGKEGKVSSFYFIISFF